MPEHDPHAEMPLRVRAPAKINLYLEVLGRRPDGYHDIRTIMQTVSLYDELRFGLRADEEIVLEARGEGLPEAEQNLVVRAARLLQEYTGCRLGARIGLEKSIPAGGGLGGGSSDCAATLVALNRLWRLGLPMAEMEGLAAQLGSDVAFFLHGGAALCEGKGERVTPLPVGGEFHYVLMLTGIAVATRDVYQVLDERLTNGRGAGSMDSVQRGLVRGDVEELGRNVSNALENPAFRLSPGLRQVAERLRRLAPELGCVGLSLSGSGGTFYGVFCGPQAAQEAAQRIGKEGCVSAMPVHGLLCSSLPW